MKLQLSKNDRSLKGTITLEGSKSISNRALIIQALTTDDFKIEGLSISDDTSVLKDALATAKEEYDLGHAGTSYRFLTALKAFEEGTQILKGSERMYNRPIGPLVEALNHIGADIEYLEKEGYPPLKINAPKENLKNTVALDSSVSSQFITALCLIAPTLPEGLTIHLDGDMVSRSYVEMTLSLMHNFGVSHSWEENQINIPSQEYVAKDFKVEADWSAASYYYVMAAYSEEVDLTINGLKEESLQGDSAIKAIGAQLGVESTFVNGSLHLKKSATDPTVFFEYDFINCPDIAQSVALMCAAAGTQGLFTGLQTLKIKETDRIAALKKELSKAGIIFYKIPSKKFAQKSGKEYYMMEGKANLKESIEIETYKDHRIAMAFAPMALLHPIIIFDPDVVSKSYPTFWKDLESLGFTTTRLETES